MDGKYQPQTMIILILMRFEISNLIIMHGSCSVFLAIVSSEISEPETPVAIMEEGSSSHSQLVPKSRSKGTRHH